MQRRPESTRGLVTTAGLVFVVGLVAGLSCTSTTTNENHCFYNAGNATCADRYGTALPYCATTCAGQDGNADSPNEDGCVDYEPPDGCYSPCGNELDVTDDSTCLDTGGTDPTSTTTTMTSAPTTTDTEPTTSDEADTTLGTTVGETEGTDTGPMTCQTSGDCTNPALPICVDDICRACTDSELPVAECTAKDPDLPACNEDGECVQCTATHALECVNETPVCGDEVCRACAGHPECPATACDFSTGECFPSGCVRDVPGDAPTIQAALDDVADQVLRCTIRVGDDLVGADAGYIVAIDGGPPRAIVRAGGTAPYRINGAGGPTLRVAGGAVVYLGGLRISGNVIDIGVEVTGGSLLYIDDSEVVDNNGGGIIVSSLGEVQLRNSVVGGDVNNVDAVLIVSGEATMVDSTLFAGFGTATALSCNPAGSAIVRNSILLASADTPETACTNLDVAFSAMENDPGGEGNVEVGDADNGWFANVGGADFHLTAMGDGVFAGIGRWVAGDPLVDIDGDLRVQIDGAMEHAGADLP